MNKIVTLENGLKIVFYVDKNKHSNIAYLITKFGGLNKELIINDDLKTIPSGCAHFLEHILIEYSKYGNIFSYFNQKYVRFNGSTSNTFTNFYIDTIEDFYENLKILIEVINNPFFKEEDVLKTKGAILEEIGERVDNNFYKLDKLVSKSLFKNSNYNNVLGSKEDINSINYLDLINCYNTFYRPDNQILVIAGNVDIDKTVKIVEVLYDKLFKERKDETKYKIKDIKLPREIGNGNKDNLIKVDINSNYTKISYKIDISNFSNYEKVKLSFYISFFLNNHFGGTSNFYKTLINKKISVYDIDSSHVYLDDYLILELGTYTNKKEELVKLVQDEVNNIKFKEKDFINSKKQAIIGLILREERLYDVINPFVDNILSFNYYDIDKISDVDSYTFKDYQEVISKLDFSNYTINSLVK